MEDNIAGRPAAAARRLKVVLATLEELRREHPDDPAVGVALANALITFAVTRFLTEGLDGALEAMGSAEVVIGELDGDEAARMAPRWRFQMASILGQAGQLTRALDLMTTLVEEDTAFTGRERCAILLTRGMMFGELGRHSEAARSFGAASALAASIGDEPMRVTARHDEAYATYLAGDLPGALALMSANDTADGLVNHADLDTCLVLLDAGLITEAVDGLTTVRRGLGRSEWRPAAEAELELARAYRYQGDLVTALTFARSAKRRYLARGAALWAERASLLQLQIEVDRGRVTARQLDAAEEIVEAAGAHGDVALADRARTVAAEAEALRGRYPEAQAQLDAAPDTARSMQGVLHRAHVEALVHRGSGDPAAARRTLLGGAKVLARARRGSASLDLRTATSIHGVRLADLDLDMAIEQGAGHVLASLDRWRTATDRLPDLRPPSDPGLAALTEQLRSTQDRAREVADPDQIAELSRRIGDLHQRIRARDWALARRGLGKESRPASIAASRVVLDELDRDLVWFATHRGRILGVAVIGRRAVVRDLMSAREAAELAQRLRADLQAASTLQLGGLRAAVWGSLRATATALDDALLRPWRASGTGLVVVPCHELTGIPWGLLPSLVGRPVTVSRSLGTFATRAATTSTRPSVHVSVGPRLHRAAEEARAVAAAWAGSETRVDHPSSAAGLVRATTAYDLIHVAAHGTHRSQSPLFSSLDLDDGPVFAHEFQPHGITARHVVLSACDVGTPTIRPGEEALGLAASILSLGATCVVGAVSPIPDDIAAEVMAAHHRALAAGCRTDEALALAIAATDPVAASFLSMGSIWQAVA